jgi:glutamate transport system substrate-binding protein
MGKLRRAVVFVALVGSLVTSLAACGGSAEGPNQQPSQVPGATGLDKLTIGISFDQPGLGFKDGDTFSGFDVETAKYVAKALGVPESGITWVQADPGNRESLLTSGQADLVLSTYTIT